MLTSLAVGAANVGKRCIIVVPSEYLVGQMVDDIKPFWESVTGASGKRTPKLGSDILVVTANSAKKFIDVYDIVLIDESHKISCDTYQEFIMCADKAECIYTMTATPFRADGLDLILNALGGPVVYEFSVKKGIEEGYLTRPEIHCINIDPGFEIGSRKMATTAYSKLIMNAKVYGAIFSSLEKALASGKNCIVMFKTVKAGDMFKKYCKGKIDFEVANGNYKKPLIDFRDGKTNILVACDKLIGEGISINQADVLFLLTQHTSDVMTYQSIGRVLRLFPGKEKAIIIDIAVKGYRQFENAREKRIAVYKDIITESNQLIIKG
jgi:superfamily II DNA or RNA helicase